MPSPLVPTLVAVYEHNDPAITFTILTRNTSTGVRTPYSLSGLHLECYVKVGVNSPDSAPIAHYSFPGTGIIVQDVLGGVLTVQFDQAATATPGSFHYRVDSVDPVTLRRVTLVHGPFQVVSL